ncbi:MAG: amidohydrolase family protein [Chloroflexota bacterium]|nr:amidohydrolase family protein [Chloroflexota bacterium]
MQRRSLIISQKTKINHARFILTLDPDRRIIQDGSIVIDGTDITHIAPSYELSDIRVDRIIDASDMVITPGFINCHMHISYAHAVRGIYPDNIGPQYLPTVFKLQQEMTEEEEYYTTLLGITELVKYGTTCFMDPGTTKFLGSCLPAYETAGCRIIIGSNVVDQTNPLNIPVSNTKDALYEIERVIDQYHNNLNGMITAWAMPFSPVYCSHELLQGAKNIADKYNTGLTLHYNNSEEYVSQTVEQYGKLPTQILSELGLLGPNVLLAHALGLDESELQFLDDSGTKIVICPTAALKSGAGISHKSLVPEMLNRGITVGLGTDAANNSNLIETMRSMYLSAVMFKDGRTDVNMVPAETALEMATLNSATALGLQDSIGSLEIGKRADIVLFDTIRPEWGSLFNPVNNLVYSADGRSVHTVFINGRLVVSDHEPLFIDQSDLVHKVQRIGESLLNRTGIHYPSNWPVIR